MVTPKDKIKRLIEPWEEIYEKDGMPDWADGAAGAIAKWHEAELAGCKAQVAEMRGAILDVEEWIANDQHQPEYYCAFCGNEEDEGHTTNCARQKALSAVKEES